MEDGPPSEAWTDSVSLAAVCPATCAAAPYVSAPVAGSVAGAAALAAAVSFHQPSVALAVGGPVLASAGVSVVPVLASPIQARVPVLAV